MMKKKKIKDPEKYIGRLKSEIKRLDGRLFRVGLENQALRGNVIVNWNPHEKQQTCAGDYALGCFRPGEKVVIIGRVTKSFTEIDEDCGNKRSGITYKVLETRRIKE